MTNVAINQIGERCLYTTSKMELSVVSHKVLRMKFKGFQLLSNAKESHQKIIQIIEEYGIKLLLIDQRELRVLSTDMKLFMSRAADDLAKFGIQKSAILHPENIFVKAGIKNVEENVNEASGVNYEVFEREIDAIKWLLA